MSYDQVDWGTNYFKTTFGSSYDYPLSLVAWVKCANGDPGWDSTGNHYICQFGESDSSDVDCLRVGIADAAVDVYSVASGGGSAAASKSAGDTYNATWVCIAAVYSAATDRKVYIENSTSPGSSTTNIVLTTLVQYLRIGRLMSGFGGFEGKIAEVAIFDKALSEGEVDLLQSASETGPAPNTVASSSCIGYWPLAVDGVFTDASGNSGPTLTEVGTATFAADHPTITTSTITDVHFRGSNRGILRGVGRGVG